MTEHLAAEALRASRGNAEAFTAFYDAHAKNLLASLTRRTCDPEVAVDLFAETFAQAYRSRSRFRGSTDAEAGAWLYRIAERQLARYFRKRRAEQSAMRRLGIELPRLTEGDYREVEELADLPSVRRDLEASLRRLSPSQRAALELRVVNELPYREVARRLEISEQAARARVARALRTLGDALGKETTPEVTR